MFKSTVMSVVMVTVSMFCLNANAVIIDYTATHSTGNTYSLTYSITNDDFSAGISELTVYYDYTIFSNISATQSLGGWEPLLAIQPDSGLPDDGFVDALTFGLPVAAGDPRIDNFMTVNVDCTVCNFADGQYFEVYDLNWDNFRSGTTTLTADTQDPTSVPEPTTASLFLLGLAGLMGYRKIAKN